MVPTNSITVFLRHNDSELRSMFGNLCFKLKYAGSFDDLVQDFYCRMLTSNILQGYNRHYTTSSKYTTCRLSSYLYPILRNFVLSKIKSPEYRNITKKAANYEVDPKDAPDMDDQGPLDDVYQDVVERNAETDSCDGVGTDLRMFYNSFKGSKDDKLYVPKLVEKGFSRATLSKVFKCIYEGYTFREIAATFGVSTMFISLMKQQLAMEMEKYGFNPEKRRKNAGGKVSKVSI